MLATSPCQPSTTDFNVLISLQFPVESLRSFGGAAGSENMSGFPCEVKWLCNRLCHCVSCSAGSSLLDLCVVCWLACHNFTLSKSFAKSEGASCHMCCGSGTLEESHNCTHKHSAYCIVDQSNLQHATGAVQNVSCICMRFKVLPLQQCCHCLYRTYTYSDAAQPVTLGL